MGVARSEDCRKTPVESDACRICGDEAQKISLDVFDSLSCCCWQFIHLHHASALHTASLNLLSIYPIQGHQSKTRWTKWSNISGGDTRLSLVFSSQRSESRLLKPTSALLRMRDGSMLPVFARHGRNKSRAAEAHIDRQCT